MLQLPSWITHYNEVHPDKALDIVRLASSSQLAEIPDRVLLFGGYNTMLVTSLAKISFSCKGSSSGGFAGDVIGGVSMMSSLLFA